MATNRCRTTLKRLDCGNIVETQAKNTYEPFSVCLPFGRRLVWDGQGLRLQGRITTTDGKYGLFTVENGCITSAEEQPACEYTAQPCTPAATPCGGDGTSSISLQPGPDNILNFDASGRLGGQIRYSTNTEGLTISGYGTTSSPLVIDYTPGDAEKTYVQGTTSAVTVTGDGTATSPYAIAHIESALGAGTYGGFTIDSFGHVTGYEEQDLGLTKVQAGIGINATQNGTIATVSLPAQSDTYGTRQLGGFNVSVDGQGIVTGFTQVIGFPLDDEATSFTLNPEYNDLEFNAFGSLVAYNPKTPVAKDHFIEVFDAGRTSTSFTFTTTKSAHFKITYRGRLPANSPGNAIYGYYALPAPYSITINNKRISAQALYSSAHSGIIEVVVVSDAMYSAGAYTIVLSSSNDDFTFTDGATLEVELVARGD